MTAALAVRALDHVPEVRDAALDGLRNVMDVEVAPDALKVILAGRHRHFGPAALTAVTTMLLECGSPSAVAGHLMTSSDRDVRRWAFEFAHGRDLLTRENLLTAVASEKDQLLLAWCAEWLMDVARPEDFAELLTARSVNVRLTAITKVPDADLPDDALLALTADRAPRLREAARWRARRRNLDVAAWYRGELSAGDGSVIMRAACLDGLASLGGVDDLGLFLEGISDPAPRVRAAAVGGLAATSPDEAPAALLPLLLDPSPRVASRAARVLSRAGVGADHSREAWASRQAWSRRAGWRLMRGCGGWDRVEADLRAAADGDPHLAGEGSEGIRSWLASAAATTWQPLAGDQRDRIGVLLSGWSSPDQERRAVAFHAGIRPLPSTPRLTAPEPNDRPPSVGKARRWFSILRRR
ncbi:HEAT repeat domain-containing protein [Nocardioides sp. InS609-2]|uniref:HEAT repeat domain-containing protein n=1 Tax=Nocardioides sp. InS609-2 TaxID=2760705 RepID=UPI0020BD4CA5|nr:HEAT repeat domain-containing protein [Nocardioides sp. InS609-2]